MVFGETAGEMNFFDILLFFYNFHKKTQKTFEILVRI